MAIDNVRYDINGYDVLTKAMQSLLNQFPLLKENESIGFSVVDADEGFAFFPTNGAIVDKETRDVIGHVQQECAYPIIVFYKASGLSETGKINAKEWLETLGMWLERQTINVDGIEHKLSKYPPINGNCEITLIERTTPSYLTQISDDLVDSWAINITAHYKNEFDLLG